MKYKNILTGEVKEGEYSIEPPGEPYGAPVLYINGMAVDCTFWVQVREDKDTTRASRR